jgi:hypothetical protein
MCVQCVTGGGLAVYEAAVMIGGPAAYAAYRRVRIRMGFGDPAAVPVEPVEPVAPPAPERPRRAPVPSPVSG